MPIPRRSPRTFLALLLALALLAPTLALTPLARADSCTVTDTGDAATGQTLRALLAGPCATINFQPGLGSITLTDTLTISRTGGGPGARKGQPDHPGDKHLPPHLGGCLRCPRQSGHGGGYQRADPHQRPGRHLLRWQPALLGCQPDPDRRGPDRRDGDRGRGGAGLAIVSGTTHLTGVTVSGNTAAGNARYGTGAGISIEDYHGNTDVTIASSTITNNQDTGGYGGGGSPPSTTGRVSPLRYRPWPSPTRS